MKNETAQTLTEQDKSLELEIESPLTVEEKHELQESENRIEKAKELIKNAALIIVQEFARIRSRVCKNPSQKTLS